MSNFTIEQLDAPGLWHVKYEGVVTGATRNEALSAFVRLVEEQGPGGQDVHGIVVDLRETDMQISVAEAYAFGARLASEPGLGLCRLVFLETDELAERSKFLETVALNRGRQARVMTDWNAAVRWLGGQKRAETPPAAPVMPSAASRRGRFLRPGVPGGSL